MRKILLNFGAMSALYLGVVVLPLTFLVWNLGVGGLVRRRWRARFPASLSTATLRARGRRVLRNAPVRLRTMVWRRGSRAAVSPSAAVASVTFEELAPELPRSPSALGWEPASGYAAQPGRVAASRSLSGYAARPRAAGPSTARTATDI